MPFIDNLPVTFREGEPLDPNDLMVNNTELERQLEFMGNRRFSHSVVSIPLTEGSNISSESTAADRRRWYIPNVNGMSIERIIFRFYGNGDDDVYLSLRDQNGNLPSGLPDKLVVVSPSASDAKLVSTYAQRVVLQNNLRIELKGSNNFEAKPGSCVELHLRFDRHNRGFSNADLYQQYIPDDYNDGETISADQFNDDTAGNSSLAEEAYEDAFQNNITSNVEFYIVSGGVGSSTDLVYRQWRIPACNTSYGRLLGKTFKRAYCWGLANGSCDATWYLKDSSGVTQQTLFTLSNGTNGNDGVLDVVSSGETVGGSSDSPTDVNDDWYLEVEMTGGGNYRTIYLWVVYE